MWRIGKIESLCSCGSHWKTISITRWKTPSRFRSIFKKRKSNHRIWSKLKWCLPIDNQWSLTNFSPRVPEFDLLKIDQKWDDFLIFNYFRIASLWMDNFKEVFRIALQSRWITKIRLQINLQSLLILISLVNQEDLVITAVIFAKT